VSAQQQTLTTQIDERHDQALAAFTAAIGQSRRQQIENIRQRSEAKQHGLHVQRTVMEAHLSHFKEWSSQLRQYSRQHDHTRAMDAIIKMQKTAKEFESKPPSLTPCASASAFFTASAPLDSSVITVGRVWDSDAVAGSSKAEGQGLRVTCFEGPSHFTITAVDETGQHCKTGGAVFDVQVEGAPDADVRVTDKNDGTYAVQYVVQHGQGGPLRVRVMYRDSGIQGSPFGPLLFVDSSKCSVSREMLTDARVGVEFRVGGQGQPCQWQPDDAWW